MRGVITMSLANWLALVIELMTMTQLFLLGRKRRAGWMVALACQAVWLPFCLITRNWPFLVGVGIFGYIDWRGLRNWKAAT